MSENYNDSRPVNTNRQNYIFVYIFVSILLLAGLIFLFKSSLFEKREANAQIASDEFSLSESLVYSDNTRDAKKWLWEFGNGDSSPSQNGTYRFRKPGSYIVRLTVDGKLQQQFPVNVRDTLIKTVQDTVVTINGPTSGIVNEEIRLEANGSGKMFEWSFGETGRVDMKGPNAFYTYQKPGTYTVILRTDIMKKPVYQRIVITDPRAALDTVITPGDDNKKVMDDLRARLQAIASGKDFNSNYYYIVRKYTCGDEKAAVQIEADGQKKQSDLYSYCMRLTFGGGVVIDEAQVTLKPNSTCASMINIKQHSNSGRKSNP